MTTKTISTVYLICGFIGAGKTTFAKKLESETGSVRITKDEWSIRLIGNDPTIAGYAAHDRKIIDLSRDVAFQLVSKGVDVIVDEGFWEKDQRLQLRSNLERLGAVVAIYYVDTPIEVIRERVAKRNKDLTHDSFIISPELLDHYFQYWQPPEEDENVIRVSEFR